MKIKPCGLGVRNNGWVSDWTYVTESSSDDFVWLDRVFVIYSLNRHLIKKTNFNNKKLERFTFDMVFHLEHLKLQMNLFYLLLEDQIYVYIHNKLIFDYQLNHWHINLMQMDIHNDDEIQIEIVLKEIRTKKRISILKINF